MRPETPPLPSETDFRAALVVTSRSLRVEFENALAAVDAAMDKGTPLFDVMPIKRVDESTFQMGWFRYSHPIWEALQAARRVVNDTRFQGLYLREMPSSVEELDAEPLPFVMAFLETVHHRERTSEGLVARCIENGTLLRALRLLRDALVDSDQLAL